MKQSPDGTWPQKLWILGTRGIPNRYGGFESLAQELSQEIRKVGGCCEVLANSTSLCRTSVLLRFAISLSQHLLTPIATWVNSRQILRFSGDYVLVTNPVNVVTALRLSRKNLSVVLHLDGIEDQRGKWSLIHRLAHKLARRVAVRSRLLLVADSKAIEEWYRTRYHRETSFIPYGGCRQATFEISHRWVPRPERKYLVIARPVPENQTLEIIRAFNASGNPGLLEVIGESNENNRYWQMVREEADLNPNVILRGAVWKKSELCEAILHSSALIHGHSVGGTNPSLVDAVSHGIPVIAHDNKFNREVLDDKGIFWIDAQSLRVIFSNNDISLIQPDTKSCQIRYQWNQVACAYLRLFNCGSANEN